DVDPDVAEPAEEDEVARPHGREAHVASDPVERGGVVREAHPEPAVDPGDEAGAVEAGGRRAAPAVRDAELLPRETHRACAKRDAYGLLRQNEVGRAVEVDPPARGAGAAGCRVVGEREEGRTGDHGDDEAARHRQRRGSTGRRRNGCRAQMRGAPSVSATAGSYLPGGR